MADHATRQRPHNIATGTAETAVDGAKGAAKGVWNWGRAGLALGVAASAALGFGVATLLGGSAIAAVVGVVGAIASLPVTIPLVTPFMAYAGAAIGGLHGASKGVERVGAEQQAYNQAKFVDNELAQQAAIASVQGQALQNVQVLQAMEQQAMQQQQAMMAANDQPTLSVAGAQAEPETRITPSTQMQESVPGLKEAANDNAQVSEMIEKLEAASHADHVAADKAAAATAETAR